MGVKKKGKGSKLARMSEEERLRYLQHRAAVEEEARRRKEQLIATFMKNKLKREEGFSRLNVAKLNQHWRQTLRRYKCIELQQEFEGLFKWFVHTASKKTYQTDVLLNDLNEVEFQHSRIRQCHAEIVDELLDLHQQRVNFFQNQYEEDQKEIYDRAIMEMKSIISSSAFDQDHLKAVLFRMEEEERVTAVKMELKQSVKSDNLRNNMLAELENLITSREKEIECLWVGIQTVLKDYWESTEDRRRQYIALRDADLENCKQIFFYYKQINNEKFLIMELKDQLMRAEKNRGEQLEEVKKERKECNQLFKVFRKQLMFDREMDKNKLLFLTRIAADTTEVLTRILQKGEQVIQLLFLCNKMEMLADKICFHTTDMRLISEEQGKILQKEVTLFHNKLAHETNATLSKFNNFWKRYNHVLIDKEAATLDIKSLELEQKELKNKLKNYISDAMLIDPFFKIRLTISRPFTSHVCHASKAVQRSKIFSRAPYTEARECPSVRYMIFAKSGK